jgi:hypothetical protein
MTRGHGGHHLWYLREVPGLQMMLISHVETEIQYSSGTVWLSGIFPPLPPQGPLLESHRGHYLDWVSVPT